MPKAINDICQSIDIFCKNPDINSKMKISKSNSHSKSASLTLKLNTNDLINELNDTVGELVNDVT